MPHARAVRGSSRREPRSLALGLLSVAVVLIANTPAQSPLRNGMVATSFPLASQAGLRILQQGGNAADAAVASAAVIAVINPFLAGLGGVGGHALVYDAKAGKTEALDLRGVSPRAATLEMYRGDKLWDPAKRATFGYLSPLVPGIIGGWAALHDRYGSMSWPQLLAPAIELAENGFPITDSLARTLSTTDARRYPYGLSLFTKDDADLKPGELWVQKDLAGTLKAIAANGPDDFYKGSIAQKIATHFQENGGLITEADLAAYRAKWNPPLSTTYRGYKVVTTPPGSSGMTLLQFLNVLEGFDLEKIGRNSAEYIHLIAETEKLAFLDDDKHGTAKSGAMVPVSNLISKTYAAEQRAQVDRSRARFYPPFSPPPIAPSSLETHHHTVVDKDHNIVTITQTLMNASGVSVPGTGIIFNNGMCYFSLDPNDVNRIEGGQRTRSTMVPTIVFRDDKPYLAVGAAGGWTIPQTVLQTILNVLDFKLEIAKAAAGPRFILRFLTNSIPYVPGTELGLNAGIPTEAQKELESRGHRLIPGGRGNLLNAILIDPKTGTLSGSGQVAAW